MPARHGPRRPCALGHGSLSRKRSAAEAVTCPPFCGIPLHMPAPPTQQLPFCSRSTLPAALSLYRRQPSPRVHVATCPAFTGLCLPPRLELDLLDLCGHVQCHLAPFAVCPCNAAIGGCISRSLVVFVSKVAERLLHCTPDVMHVAMHETCMKIWATVVKQLRLQHRCHFDAPHVSSRTAGPHPTLHGTPGPLPCAVPLTSIHACMHRCLHLVSSKRTHA